MVSVEFVRGSLGKEMSKLSEGNKKAVRDIEAEGKSFEDFLKSLKKKHEKTKVGNVCLKTFGLGQDSQNLV